MSDSKYLELAAHLSESILPKFDSGFDGPLLEDDFRDYVCLLERVVNHLYEYSSHILNILNSFEPTKKNAFIIQLFILCGENNAVSLWCSHETQEMCYSLLNSLLSSCDCTRVGDFLCDSQGKYLKMVLQKLKPFLLKNTWKKHPTAVICYSWLLMNLKMPYIDENLPALLPTALIITDDFAIENKIIGVKCLHHIIEHSTCAALKDTSYDQVIFKTLELGYRDKDAYLIPELTSCTLTLLSKMYLHQSNTHWKVWSNYDVFLNKYCLMMRMEVNNDVKKSLMQCLPDVIEACGLSTVRFLKNLTVIFEEYTFIPSTVMESLVAIEKTIQVCLPRGNAFIEDLVFIVLKIFYSLDSYMPINPAELVSACTKVLAIVNTLKPEILLNLKESSEYDSLDLSVWQTVDNMLVSS